MSTELILKALNMGVVRIWFTSLKSGNEIEGHFTLKNRNVGKVNPKSDKIVAFDLDRGRWEDIEVKTINQWISIPNNP